MPNLGFAEIWAQKEATVLPAAPRYDFSQDPEILDETGKAWPLHAGQKEAWDAEERIVSICAGSRGGKTILGPYWVLRELQNAGGGDFLVVGPTYPLMDRRLVPECQAVWEHKFQMGAYLRGYRMFRFNEKGLAMLGVKKAAVYFAFAEDPESLESMTAVGCWRDETGQSKFSREASEAIRRRLSIATKNGNGRILDTSTPYIWNWWKHDVFDKGHVRVYFDDKGRHEDVRQGGDPEIKIVSYRSIDNPSFPIKEWESLQSGPSALPDWKFRMMNCGEFTRPAGTVYDCFEFTQPGGPQFNTCKRFKIPDHWQVVAGHDFGPVHTAGVWLAKDPETKKWYLFATYLDGNKSTEEHADAFQKRSQRKSIRAWGGARSEDSARSDFCVRGYAIMRPPIKEVDDGIQAVYTLFKRLDVVIFDDLHGILKEVVEYSYDLDMDDQPMSRNGRMVIVNKEKYHRLDCLRSVGTAIYMGLTDDFEVADRFASGELDEDYEDGAFTNQFEELGF